MAIRDDIRKVTSFIHENTRASKTSGIKYIDPRNHKSKVLLKQNQVIFGRRGAGKSSLIKTLTENASREYFFSYRNLEDLKDITFPNILIHVLKDFSKDICREMIRTTHFYQILKRRRASKACRELNAAIRDFERQLANPDSFDEELKTKRSSASTVDAGIKYDPVSLSVGAKDAIESETARKVVHDKLDLLKNSVPQLKASIDSVQAFAPDTPIFLVLDDFYFLNKEIQIHFIDFFHKLTKDTNFFIKVATIRHRSRLYAKTSSSYFGTELGHDIQEIDLDYNLNRFDELKEFMRSLISECSLECSVSFTIDDIFSDGGFTQLCLASGGVPRDFLTLFVKVSENYNDALGRRISKTNINEAAIQNLIQKNASMGTDSAEEKDLLETYLAYIKEKIIQEKKTSMFLVSNTEIENYAQERQALRELVDLRMIHLVEPDTSAAGGVSGQRYTAYMVDIGLYPSSQQRDFKQLDPGVTDNAGRKDEMRGAPKLNLEDLSNAIRKKNLPNQLGLFES